MAEWRKNDVEKLIKLFHCEPDLWDERIPTYSKRFYRLRSLDILKEGLGNKYTADEINTKIKHLRSYYAKELAKVRKSTKSGTGTSRVYRSKWAHFNSLDVFLRCQIKPRPDRNKKVSERKALKDQSDDRESLEREDNRSSGNFKVKQENICPSAEMTEEVSVLGQLKDKMDQGTPRTDITSDEDEDTVFWIYLVNEFRKIKSPSVKNAVRLKLQTVIFDAQEEQTRSTNHVLDSSNINSTWPM